MSHVIFAAPRAVLGCRCGREVLLSGAYEPMPSTSDRRLLGQATDGRLVMRHHGPLSSQSFVEQLLWRRRTTEDIMPSRHADGRKAILALRKVVIWVCDRGRREGPTTALPDCLPQTFACSELCCLASRDNNLPASFWISPFPGGA
jgi:hypothetical protein